MIKAFFDKVILDDLTIKKKESSTLEFKEEFDLTNIKILKTMSGFANCNGGYLIFGVSDKPRRAIGITMKEFKEEELTQLLNNYFDPEIKWSHETIEKSDLRFLVIYIEKSNNKPVMCRKDKNSTSNAPITQEGRIYYRYNGPAGANEQKLTVLT